MPLNNLEDEILQMELEISVDWARKRVDCGTRDRQEVMKIAAAELQVFFHQLAAKHHLTLAESTVLAMIFDRAIATKTRDYLDKQGYFAAIRDTGREILEMVSIEEIMEKKGNKFDA